MFKADLNNLKQIFEADPFNNASQEDVIKRLQKQFSVGDLLRFPKSGIEQEVLTVTPNGLVTTVVQGEGRGRVGNISWKPKQAPSPTAYLLQISISG